MATTERTQAELDERRKNGILYFTSRFLPGTKFYGICMRTSRSRCTRYLRVFFAKDGEIFECSGMVAAVTGHQLTKDLEVATDGRGHELITALGLHVHADATAYKYEVL